MSKLINPMFNKTSDHMEQAFHESILKDIVYDTGEIFHYIPRERIEEDLITGDVTRSIFGKSVKMAGIIESMGDHEGDNFLIEQFGISSYQNDKIMVVRSSFRELCEADGLKIDEPRAGDLIYIGDDDTSFTNELFEITRVSQSFRFPMGKKLTWDIHLSLFRYGNEDFETGYDAIDDIEHLYSNDRQIEEAINTYSDLEHDDLVVDISDSLNNLIK